MNTIKKRLQRFTWSPHYRTGENMYKIILSKIILSKKADRALVARISETDRFTILCERLLEILDANCITQVYADFLKIEMKRTGRKVELDLTP